MNRFKLFSVKTAGVALSAAMLLQGTALAAPMDELNEIMEKQSEMQTESLMEQTLGFSALGEAIDDNGLKFRVKVQPDEKMLADMGAELETLQGAYGLLGLQVDTKAENWQLDAGFGSDTESLLDLSLYGDKGQLALSIPQMYAGALALKEGNLREQVMGSDLAGIFGLTQENAAQIPDIDMTFYPDDVLDDDDADMFGSMQERLEEKFEALGETAQAEKTEEGDVTTYEVTVPSADLMEVYEIVLDEYLSVFRDSGLMEVSDADELDTQLEQMLSEMETMLGDAVTVCFEVKDELVQKISYELDIDTTGLSQTAGELETELVEEDVAAAGTAADAVAEPESAVDAADTAAAEPESAADAADTAAAEPESAADIAAAEPETIADAAAEPESAADAADTAAAEPETTADIAAEPIMQAEESFRGHAAYEFTFLDPTQPAKGMDVSVQIEDEEKTDAVLMQMKYETVTEDTKETTALSMDIQENGASVYKGTPFTLSFDASTGDLDALFAVDDGTSSVEMKFDGTFTEIEKGEGFVLQVDELSVSADGEKTGLSGELTVSAKPDALAAPADTKAILELTQSGLLDLVNEISANAEAWTAKFQPETEAAAEAATEAAAEATTEAVTEAATESAAEVSTEAVTEAATEAAAE